MRQDLDLQLQRVEENDSLRRIKEVREVVNRYAALLEQAESIIAILRSRNPA